jgi:catechol 2,3-dioxygenase-like lactoylglutathione lyase family enzyme
MATELVLLGTAGAPLPVAGRAGICTALVFDGRVFVIDCGRGAPSAYADAGLDFSRLEAAFLTHLHADHVGDLPGMLLYGWGVRVRDDRKIAPVRVYGPSRPKALPSGDATFHRQTTIHPELPDPGTADLIRHILAGYAYHWPRCIPTSPRSEVSPNAHGYANSSSATTCRRTRAPSAKRNGRSVPGAASAGRLPRDATGCTEVLGGRVLFSGTPTVVALSNTWIVINAGGGPTDDKPTVTLETPRDPDRVSSFLNFRVKDIEAVYADWSARGAQFLTPPKRHQYETRCYVRDPDGYLIEVGQTTDPQGDWSPANWASGTSS